MDEYNGNNLRWTLTTITPLHIGTTDTIPRYGYIYDEEERRLHVLDLDKVAEHPSVDPEELAEQMRAREFDIKAFLGQKGIELKNVKLYSAHCCFAPRKGVRAFVKHLYQDPYVPGTTLKGAIRTALLWKMARDNPDIWKFIERYLTAVAYSKKLTERLRSQRNGSNYVAQRIEQLPQAFGPEPHFDLLRVLHVTDSEHLGANELHIIQVDVYKEQNGSLEKDGRLSPLLVEAIPPCIHLHVGIKEDDFLFSGQAEEELKFLCKRRYVDLDQDFLTACNEFACWLLNQEGSFYSGVGFKETADWCLERAKEAENLSNACLLPIGWGTGWRAKTIGRKVQTDLPKTFEQLYYQYGLGKRRGGNADVSFPVSRRVTYVCGRPLPIGWVKLSC